MKCRMPLSARQATTVAERAAAVEGGVRRIVTTAEWLASQK